MDGRRGSKKFPWSSPTDNRYQCQRCGEVLEPNRAVGLELDQRTNTFVDSELVHVPADQSQGFFYFGRTCAQAEKDRHDDVTGSNVHRNATRVKHLPGVAGRRTERVVPEDEQQL